MPRSYSVDLRKRVIEAVETGASRHAAAEEFGISASSAIKWLQRWNESGSCTPRPRGGSVSPLDRHRERILALVAAQPDLSLDEIVTQLRKRRIGTTDSSLSRFFQRHGITFKKKESAGGGAGPRRRRPGTAALDARPGPAGSRPAGLHR